MTGAFAYLILASARNRLRSRVLRLRNPRYAAAMLLGVTYIWGVYFRPSHDRPSGDEILSPSLVALLPLVTLALIAWIWLFGGDRAALAFTEAEVTLLFTAPVTRRALVLYRIARTQVAILATSILWALVFRRSGPWPALLAHVIAYWVMLATINMNRLGVALVHAGAAEHGLRAARRHWAAIAAFAGILAMVVVPLALAWPRMRATGDPSAAMDVAASVLLAPPTSWALYPFRVLVAPVSAAAGLPWLAAMGPALVLLGILTAWVLRSETAFEEAAAEASAAHAQRREALRARRGTKPVSARRLSRTLPLAPTGPPAVALLWKNAMWLLRANEVRGMLAPPAIALACAAIIAPRSEVAAVMVASLSGFVAVVMLLFGPLTTRNDLRTELLHLGLLKTFPLRGRDVVVAEVASGALPVGAVQYLLVLASLLALAFTANPLLTPAVLAAAALAAPLPVLGLNGATFTLHNGIALLFPGWVRLGRPSGGVENLGFGMIALAFVAVALVLLLVVPAGAATLALLLLEDSTALGVLFAGVVAGLLLLAEVTLCAWALGGALDRVEPMVVEG